MDDTTRLTLRRPGGVWAMAGAGGGVLTAALAATGLILAAELPLEPTRVMDSRLIADAARTAAVFSGFGLAAAAFVGAPWLFATRARPRVRRLYVVAEGAGVAAAFALVLGLIASVGAVTHALTAAPPGSGQPSAFRVLFETGFGAVLVVGVLGALAAAPLGAAAGAAMAMLAFARPGRAALRRAQLARTREALRRRQQEAQAVMRGVFAQAVAAGPGANGASAAPAVDTARATSAKASPFKPARTVAPGVGNGAAKADRAPPAAAPSSPKADATVEPEALPLTAAERPAPSAPTPKPHEATPPPTLRPATRLPDADVLRRPAALDESPAPPDAPNTTDGATPPSPAPGSASAPDDGPPPPLRGPSWADESPWDVRPTATDAASTPNPAPPTSEPSAAAPADTPRSSARAAEPPPPPLTPTPPAPPARPALVRPAAPHAEPNAGPRFGPLSRPVERVKELFGLARNAAPTTASPQTASPAATKRESPFRAAPSEQRPSTGGQSPDSPAPAKSTAQLDPAPRPSRPQPAPEPAPKPEPQRLAQRPEPLRPELEATGWSEPKVKRGKKTGGAFHLPRDPMRPPRGS